MKFKLDENIGRRGRGILETRGHDVATVLDQGLGGTSDDDLFKICVAENRVLVTLDRDFGQVMRFPPEQSAGVAVLESGGRVNSVKIAERLSQLLALLDTQSIVGALWIVEPGRVRIHLRERKV